MIKKSISRFLTFNIACAIIGLSPSAIAQEDWIAYKNENQLYEVRIPADHEQQTSELLIGNHTMAFGDRIVATVESGNENIIDKVYKVEFLQTLGAALTTDEIDSTLEALIVQYLNRHVAFGGALVARRTYSDSTGLRVADLHITYNDPEHGPSHARTRIYLSSVSKAQQTVTGPESAMFSYRSKDFFDSMSVYDGYAHHKESIETAWKLHTSPFNVFTAYLPDEDGLYVTQKPVIHNGKNSEVIGFKFYDPFLENTLSYNVYSHKFGVNLHEVYATQALQKFHLRRNNIIFRNSAFVKRSDGVIEALFPVKPTKKNNYATFGKLVAEYHGKHLLVHEIYGTETLVISNFIGNVMDSVEFHPEKAIKDQ